MRKSVILLGIALALTVLVLQTHGPLRSSTPTPTPTPRPTLTVPISTQDTCGWGKYYPVAYTVTFDLSTTHLNVGQLLQVHVGSNIGMPFFTLQIGQPSGKPAILQAVSPRAAADGQIRQGSTPTFVFKAVHPGTVGLYASANGEIRTDGPRGCNIFEWGNASGASMPIVVSAAGTHR